MSQQASEHTQTALVSFILVARHFHVDLKLESLLHRYAVHENEAGGLLLLRIAREHGFKAKATRLGWDKLLRLGGAFPAIATLTSGKTVIFSGVRAPQDEAPQVALLDPMDLRAGFKLHTKEQLEEIWDGEIVLIKKVFHLSDTAQPFSLRWFVPEVIREKQLFRDVAVSSMVINVLALGSPIFFQLIIDKVLVHKGVSTLQTLAIGMAALITFEALFQYVKKVMLLYATNKVDMRLSRRTFNHLLHLPIDFFDSSSSGVLIKHMQQTEKIRGFLTGKLLFTLLDLSILIVIFPIIFLYSGVLSSIVVGFSLCIAGVLACVVPVFKRHLHALYRAEGERQAMLVESIHGMPTVKALALEPLQSRKWDDHSASAISMQFQVGKLSMSIQTVTDWLQKLMGLAVLWIGVNMVFDTTLTVGALIAFNMLSQRVSGPLVGVVSLIHQYQEVGLSIEMLGNIMNRPTERSPSVRGLAPPIRGCIDFEHVTFRYPGSAASALHDVSLTLQAGKSIGIVGRSGSGKSTMARLIQGLYTVREATVKIDGIDLREIDLPHLRRNIGVVLQENFLFRGTVRQNIAFTKPTAAFEEVVQAARLAGADEFIQRLPQGYETMMTENGANLSGGQRQRLSIARCLLLNPRILILDEATSALDAESEAIIQTNLAGIAKGRTMCIVSHRLSMIAQCDVIAVVDAGAFVPWLPMTGCLQPARCIGNCGKPRTDTWEDPWR
ncbi:MAG: peptidase domain-containing ABC transporter [Solidesulfovibrio sp.]